MSEFIIVKGGPKVTPGEYIVIRNGQEYIIESVEELTRYNVRRVKPSDKMISGIGLERDEIELANLKGEREYHGIRRDLQMRKRRQRKISESQQ